jgi:hypothetical protein
MMSLLIFINNAKTQTTKSLLSFLTITLKQRFCQSTVKRQSKSRCYRSDKEEQKIRSKRILSAKIPFDLFISTLSFPSQILVLPPPPIKPYGRAVGWVKCKA